MKSAMQVIGSMAPLDVSAVQADALRVGLPAVLGAALGAFLWKKHRVLGALGGLAVGSNAYSVSQGSVRNPLLMVGATAAGIAASLYWKKHPAFGYLGASLGASLLASPFRE